jgi:hypothetical protein
MVPGGGHASRSSTFEIPLTPLTLVYGSNFAVLLL